MDGLPDNVFGVSAEGKITGEDYEAILIPAVKEKFITHPKLRMLYHLRNTFDGFDLRP